MKWKRNELSRLLLPLALGGLALGACASNPTAESPAGASPTESRAEAGSATREGEAPAAAQQAAAQKTDAPKDAPAAAGPPPDGESESPASAAPAPSEVIGDACEKVCARTAEACTARAADFCRARCGDYVAGAEKCPVEVLEALQCQAEAPEFNLCSNVAAEECAPSFYVMQQCRQGKVEAQVWGAEHAPEPEAGLPEHFTQRSFSDYGFVAVVPDFAKADEASAAAAGSKGTLGVAVLALRGEDVAFTEYRVEVFQRPASEKLDAKRILRTATSYVGLDCQPKLRLHGQFERQGVTYVRFDTTCEDGAVFHGMLNFWNGHVVVLCTYQRAQSQFGGHPAGEGMPEPLFLEDFLFGLERE